MAVRFFFLLIGLFCGACASVPLSANGNAASLAMVERNGDKKALPVAATIGDEDVFLAAQKTAKLLLSLLNEDGQFTYRFNLNPNRTIKAKYNILRHGGALYALGQWHEYLANNPWGNDGHQTKRVRGAIEKSMERGLRFMKKCCLTPTFFKDSIEDEVAAIGSYPTINGSAQAPVAKLGGTGLALVAIAAGETVGGLKPFSTKHKQALARFILAMQKENGSFYSKFRLQSMEVDSNWNSLYYPGEAALGLLKLFKSDREAKWFDGANQALLALANSRKNKVDVPHDHWALIALNELFLYEKKLNVPQRDAHLAHVRQLCSAIVSTQQTSMKSFDLYGAFDAWGKTAPTATRLEGLVAAENLLVRVGQESDAPLRKEIVEAIQRGVGFLVRAQVAYGKHAGAIPRAVRRVPSTDDDAFSFNRRATEVRIDYLQHALSAWVGYLQMQQAGE